MLKYRTLGPLILSLVVFTSPSAHAATANFEDLTIIDGTTPPNPLTDGGLVISEYGFGGTSIVQGPQGYGSNNSTKFYEGETVSAQGGSPEGQIITKADGKAFSLQSIDLALDALYLNQPPIAMLTGFLQMGGTVVDDINLTENFNTFSLSDLAGFKDVTSVEIDTNLIQGGAIFIDNINYGSTVSAVPLPAALPMFGASIVGLGAIRLRKRQVDAATSGAA